MSRWDYEYDVYEMEIAAFSGTMLRNLNNGEGRERIHLQQLFATSRSSHTEMGFSSDERVHHQ
jgi:hypothetical protein